MASRAGARTPTPRHFAYSPDPQRFDPEHLLPEAVRARHAYARVPFGGGAYMRPRLHFAYKQIKILPALMPSRYRVGIAIGYKPQWQAWPISRPKDGLRITLR